MIYNTEALAARRAAKIATLTAQRDALQARLEGATGRERWQVKAMLVSTERALRWQLPRAGYTAKDCGCGNKGKTSKKGARAPSSTAASV